MNSEILQEVVSAINRRALAIENSPEWADENEDQIAAFTVEDDDGLWSVGNDDHRAHFGSIEEVWYEMLLLVRETDDDLLEAIAVLISQDEEDEEDPDAEEDEEDED